MIPNGVLAPLLRTGIHQLPIPGSSARDPDSLLLDGMPLQGHRGIIHPLLHPFAQDVIHVAKDPVVLLRPHYQVKMGDALEEFLSPALRHATHETVNHMGPLLTVLAHHSHLAQGLLLSLVAHRAGVDQDGIGILFRTGEGIASLHEHPGNLLGITLVHLSSVGLDEYFGHNSPRAC